MARRETRFRFRLRTLFLVFLGLGVALTLWRVWLEPYQTEQAAMQALIKAGVKYQTFGAAPAGLGWIIGDGWFQKVGYVELEQDADTEMLERVVRLRGLVAFRVDCPGFTDEHFARLRRIPKLKIVILIRTSVSAQAVEALERERPDVAMTIRLTFEELSKTAPGAKWNTDNARQSGVLPSVRQWVGRRVQMVGHPDYAPDRLPGDVVSFELGPQAAWPAVPPGRGVAVALRSAVERKGWFHWYEGGEVGVEGILDISSDLSDYGTSVYRLSDATLSRDYLP
jgi:hypothetical protein